MSWLTDTLFATGALIALVLVLRRPVGRWFGPGMAYALWALPLLRLIIPPLILPEEQAPATFIITEADSAAGAVAPLAEAPPGWSLAETVPWVWLAGVLAFVAWRGWGYFAMRRRLLEGARPVGEAGPIRLVESAEAPGPVAFGLFDKVVALPPGFMASEDRAARDLAIAHELEHHAGRDIAVNFAMQPLLALHWFNPLAWLGWRALRRDQEAACDARVLEGRGAEVRAAYGRLIAGFAQAQRVSLATPLACPVVGEKSIIHRLRSLTMDQPSPRRRLFGRLLIGAGALALPLTASITYAASGADAPEPPAVPDVPPPSADKAHTKIVIVDDENGATPDDSKLHTRTIVRDGKTIVLKTSQPLSDSEVEAHIAKAEASMAEAEAEVRAGEAEARAGEAEARAGEAEARAEGARLRRVKIITRSSTAEGETIGEPHVFVMKSGDGAEPRIMGEDGEPLACGEGGTASNIDATEDRGGHRETVKLRFCGKGGGQAHALAAIKRAREQMAKDPNLSAEIRTKVLEELDREISRLSSGG